MLALTISKPKASARVAGHTLVAAFRTSEPPLVWHYDLKENHSFTLTLHGEEGDWDLGVTSSKGEFCAVAHFDSRDDADAAFAAVQKGLMEQNPPYMRLFRWLAIGIALFFVLGVLQNLVAQHNAGLAQPSAKVSSLAPTSPSQQQFEMKNGVPMSADDVLKSQGIQ